MYPSRWMSPPCKCYWAGWEADTYRLAQHGWQVSAREDFHDERISIAIKHPDIRAYGVSNVMRYPYLKMDHYRHSAMMPPEYPLEFQLELAHNITMPLHYRDYGRHAPWRAIDPWSEPRQLEYAVRHIEDLAIFKYLPGEDKDIIVKKPSLAEILDMALEHQAPKQKELREKARSQISAIIRVAA